MLWNVYVTNDHGYVLFGIAIIAFMTYLVITTFLIGTVYTSGGVDTWFLEGFKLLKQELTPGFLWGSSYSNRS